jgi:hypothetical protein
MRKQIVTLAVLSAGAVVSAAAMAADVGDSTTVGGRIFADFGDINQKSNDVDVPPTGVGFDVKRAYLIVNHTFDDIWSANLTTDAQYIGTATNTGLSNSTTASSGGVTEMFIKLLYVQAKLNPAFTIHAGSYSNPWLPYVENLYGYRFVEKTANDRLGFANSADWGINASGAVGPGTNGFFNYSISEVDGGGYKNPTRTKTPDTELRVGVSPLSWLNVGAGFYTGHLGQVTQANDSWAKQTATRWNVAAGVQTSQLRVGLEYFDAKDFKAASASTGVLGGPGGVVVAASATGAVTKDEADGISSWASWAFDSHWSVFGRYDNAKLSKDIDPNLRDTYYNLGVDFKPSKPLDLALVYKHEDVKDGSVSISGADGNASDTIGGTGAAGTGTHSSGEFNEVGIYTQVQF